MDLSDTMATVNILGWRANTWTMESRALTHGPDPRRTSQPPTSTAVLIKAMAANLGSRVRLLTRVVRVVLSLWMSMAASAASPLGFWSWAADRGCLQRMTWLIRDGSE